MDPRPVERVLARSLRSAGLGLSAAALYGCTLHYEVEATAHDKAVAFALPDRPHRSCLDSFEVKRRGGGIMWRVGKRDPSSPCAATFPIQYGVVPAGFTQQVAAADLQIGAIYEVSGSGNGAYSGAFKLLPSGEALNRWTEY